MAGGPDLFVQAFGLGAMCWVVMFVSTRVHRHYGERLQSLSWLKAHRVQVYFLVGVPFRILLFPAIEEIVFRSPLLALFRSFSPLAWVGIAVSAAAFGAVHFRGSKIGALEVQDAASGGEPTDSPAEAMARAQASFTGTRRRRITHVTLSFLLGLLCGSAGIAYQSLFAAYLCHASWNLVVPPIGGAMRLWARRRARVRQVGTRATE